MNPFLERNWGPVHTALIGYIWEEVGRQLPEDLVARPEERIEIDEVTPPSAYRPDVAVSEDWKSGTPRQWTPGTETESAGTLAEPQMVWVEELIERWIEIRTAEGRLVTAVELLSPANKTGGGWDTYRRKQRAYLQSRASLVEIDLLRQGTHVLAAPLKSVAEKAPGTCYHICVSRASTPQCREVYSCPLRERLPAFRLPLRETDSDIALDLQPLIDRCYEAGRYYLSPHDRDPEPPFADDAETAWVHERLAAAGLR
ncbi:MAG: DUF4058 family protein [Akkermansiaceae bacterium]|nr:DUF4058 family protein [Akkermansiaceae bacterium]